MAKTNDYDFASIMADISKDYKTNFETQYLDSGSVIMNMAFGGGFPLGKNIEIYSESGYGKSTIVLSMCKKLCQQGHKVLYIDAEGSIDKLIESMKIHTDDETDLLWSPDKPDNPFVVLQTCYFEDIEKALERMIPNYDSNGHPLDSNFRLIVIDSVAALCPKEYRGDTGEKESLSIASNKPGVMAKLMTAFIRKFNGYKTMYNCSFLYINQMRDNLGLSYADKYKDMTPGGKALYYFCDIILKLNSRSLHKEKKETGFGEIQEVTTEREVNVVAVKNKLTNGGIGLPLQVRFGIGISNIAAMPYLLPKKYIVNDKGEEIPMLQAQGAWFTLSYNVTDGDKPGFRSQRLNGKPQLQQAIRDNYKYIYSVITQDDFKLLIEEPVDDE